MTTKRIAMNMVALAGLAMLVLVAAAPAQEAMLAGSDEETFTGPQQRGPIRGMRGMRGMQGRMRARAPLAEELGLTDDQKEKLRTLRQESRKASIQAQADMQIKQMELRELLQSGEPDRAAIAQKLEEIAAARTARALDRFDQRQAMKSILTPEQQAKMKTLHRRGAGRMRGQRRRGRHGMRRGFRPGGRPGQDGIRRPHPGGEGPHGPAFDLPEAPETPEIP